MPQQTPYSLFHQIRVEMCSTHQWNGNTLTTILFQSGKSLTCCKMFNERSEGGKSKECMLGVAGGFLFLWWFSLQLGQPIEKGKKESKL